MPKNKNNKIEKCKCGCHKNENYAHAVGSNFCICFCKEPQDKYHLSGCCGGERDSCKCICHSHAKQEAIRECKAMQSKCDDLFQEYIDPYVEKKVQEAREDVLKEILEQADINIEDRNFNRTWFKSHIREYAKSKGIKLEDKE